MVDIVDLDPGNDTIERAAHEHMNELYQLSLLYDMIIMATDRLLFDSAA